MLSILIPTYNYDCTAFVRELAMQAEGLHIDYEIIVCDDASPEVSTKERNRAINDLPQCRFVELAQNHGAAYCRNYLMSQAMYDNMLLLDSDLMPCRSDFLARFVQEIDGRSVICGTIKFRLPENKKEVEANLRYVYAAVREEHAAELRNRSPYSRFAGFGFLLPRCVAEQVRFCEDIVTYGHEDTLYGKMLNEAGIPVRYIDNPVYHDISDDSAHFLSKTEESLANALRHRKKLRGYVRILDVQERVLSMGLQPMVRVLFALFEKPLRRNLLSNHPRLRLFDLYKLGYICRLDHRMKRNKVL